MLPVKRCFSNEIGGAAFRTGWLCPAGYRLTVRGREFARQRTGLSCLHRSSLTLIGQVHSHPGDWVDHSEGRAREVRGVLVDRRSKLRAARSRYA